jgi:hypothetical protein
MATSQRKGETREEYLARRRLEAQLRRAANREKDRQIRREWHARNPEKNQEYKDRRQLQIHGISPQKRRTFTQKQGGACALCGQLETTDPKTVLCTDHDHSTGYVRGLLCRKCNLGLAYLGDGEEGMIKALAYLRKAKYNYGRWKLKEGADLRTAAEWVG